MYNFKSSKNSHLKEPQYYLSINNTKTHAFNIDSRTIILTKVKIVVFESRNNF